MTVQDDRREFDTRLMFGLEEPPARQRGGIDAVLELEGHPDLVPFELKSTTKSTVATVRDFGPEHVVKWQNMHWLFAFYEDPAQRRPAYCRYASPAAMAPWIADKQAYVLPDLVLAERAPQRVTDDDLVRVLGDRPSYTRADAKSIMKNQWSRAQYRDNADLPKGEYSRDRMLKLLQERCAYVIRRGATLNNPHIPKAFLAQLPRIDRDHAATLKALVQAYLDEQRQAKARGDETVVQPDPVVVAQASAAATDDATA